MYIGTFVLLMITNVFIWWYVRWSSLKKQEDKQALQLILISLAFAVSYLYRFVSDILQAVNPEAWE
jgi:hypothetical protein